MSFLPKDVQKALEDAHISVQRKSRRLCVHIGDRAYPVARLWANGFAISAQDAPKLRGHADIYDGARHVSQCLIMTSREEAGERIYDFKWNTDVATQPAIDYVRSDDAPVALLPAY